MLNKFLHRDPGEGRYPLAADTIGVKEIAAAKEVLDSGQLTMNRRVRAFEEQFAEWVGVKHAIMVNSGSSANLLIVDSLLQGGTSEALLQRGDEVIVPALSWPTTVWPLAQLGLIPVFADVDPRTLAIDIQSATSLIGPRTRAMFLIHPLGRAVDISSYLRFCQLYGLLLIEDACESLGAHCSGRHVGTFGIGGTFSFYFSHHISTIEGGMIVTQDAALADRLRGLRAHGWVRDRRDRHYWTDSYPDLDPRFLFASTGYNVRPTEIQAAIGTVQLSRLDEMLEAREVLAGRVGHLLREHVPWLELIGMDSDWIPAGPNRRLRRHSWMTLPLRIAPSAPTDRRSLVQHLEQSGVETRPIIAGNIVRHPGVLHITYRVPKHLSVADSLLDNALMIGCHPVLSDDSLATLESAIVRLGDL